VKAWLKHAQPFVLALAVAAAFAACDEQLDAGLACPALCPQRETTVRDTTIFAIAIDSSIAGFPAFGAEPEFYLASLGDTLETRGVVRYDSLPQTFRYPNTVADSTITSVDTGAVVKLRLSANDTLAGPVTVEVYDVDLNGPDNDDPTLATDAFVPERLIGTRTFEAAELKDSIRVPIDPDVLLNKILQPVPNNRLRIGLRVAPTGHAQLSMFASNGGGPPLLEFRPSTVDSAGLLTVGPGSKFPAEPTIAANLTDYLLVVKAPPPPPADVLRVGGIPGRRAYFRFDIPSDILDSASVVRATLFLTQRPSPFSVDATDSVAIQQFAVTAGPAVTDLSKALLFLNVSSTDTVKFAAADSGLREFEMIRLVRAWRSTSPERTPRAFALKTETEGHLARQADFFSTEAPLAVRPRLRITYLPRPPVGLP
jgi:hypothetical protein